MGAMHMVLLGPSGLEILSTRNAAAAMLAEEKLLEIKGVDAAHPNASHFNGISLSVFQDQLMICVSI